MIFRLTLCEEATAAQVAQVVQRAEAIGMRNVRPITCSGLVFGEAEADMIFEFQSIEFVEEITVSPRFILPPTEQPPCPQPR